MSRRATVRRLAARRSRAAVLACVALASLAAAACSKSASGPPAAPAAREIVEPVVARDAVPFAPGTVPGALADRLGGARVVLLGETHYVQEHQELLVPLLAQLHASGFRLILQEQMHAAAWTGDEYAMLRSDVLPLDVAAFDQTLLEGLRAFNVGLAEAERMHFAGFDMNHDPGLFQTYVALFQERFGRVAELDALLATTPGTARYAEELAALPGALAANQAGISGAIGADRYAQLIDLVAVEQWSLELRSLRDHLPARELLIRDRIVKALFAAGPAKVAVNCGAFHAQKTRLFDQWEPVGTWLVTHPEAYGGDPAALRSIAFLPARGEVLDDCCSGVPPRTIDALQEAPANDLVRILAERAGALDAWLPFDDPLFADALVSVWAGGASVALHPADLYDGMVLYSRVSVLSSLSFLP